MKITATTDKRILERELHLKGRVLEPEFARLAGELPDLASRTAPDSTDTEALRERLVAEAGLRQERIRRSLADRTRQNPYLTDQSELED